MNNLGRGESMRLSELSGKEIVNLERAEKMGVLGYVDLEVDRRMDKYRLLLYLLGNGRFQKEPQEIRVAWRQIKKWGMI